MLGVKPGARQNIRSVTYLFPSPCGVLGVKQRLGWLLERLNECLQFVSVPLRGVRRETISDDVFLMILRFLFPSPCGVLGVKLATARTAAAS